MEMDPELIRRLGNSLLLANRALQALAEKIGEQSERHERDHAELRGLLTAIARDLAILGSKLDEARSDIGDLTPPLGVRRLDLAGIVQRENDAGDTWRNVRGTIALVKRAWPVLKWLPAAGAGGALVRLIEYVRGLH
jgi:hypothetical protein